MRRLLLTAIFLPYFTFGSVTLLFVVFVLVPNPDNLFSKFSWLEFLHWIEALILTISATMSAMNYNSLDYRIRKHAGIPARDNIISEIRICALFSHLLYACCIASLAILRDELLVIIFLCSIYSSYVLLNFWTLEYLDKNVLNSRHDIEAQEIYWTTLFFGREENRYSMVIFFIASIVVVSTQIVINLNPSGSIFNSLEYLGPFIVGVGLGHMLLSTYRFSRSMGLSNAAENSKHRFADTLEIVIRASHQCDNGEALSNLNQFSDNRDSIYKHNRHSATAALLSSLLLFFVYSLS